MPHGEVSLAAGESRLVVSPATGGAIARYSWRGIDVLRPAAESAMHAREVRRMACYPLVPYSNRIGGARLAFEGREYRIRPNFPPQPHAIHGVGWQRAWSVVEANAASVTLALQHEGDGDWPFAFEATQTFRLSTESLEVRLVLRNAAEGAMPAGLGLHPFFPERSRARLQARCSGVWMNAPDNLPSHHEAVPPDWDFREPRAAGPWVVDNCFTGWDRRAVLEYATHRVVLAGSEEFGYLVCFAPGDGRDFIALEPVSHANDAARLRAEGRGDNGLRVLAPGDSFSAAMTISVYAP